MTNLDTLLTLLLEEIHGHQTLTIPDNISDKRNLLRALMNRRPAYPASEEVIRLQDLELREQLYEKGIVRWQSMDASTIDPRIKLWQGDITRLQADAIVNAANSRLLGCFVPLHACIDNAIHSAAGIQLRLACKDLIQQQSTDEPTGTAKITRGYNLPAKYVIHTVGPIIGTNAPTVQEEELLKSCYLSCLQLADRFKLKSLAFCCISTGEFHFPNQLAAEIAVNTVHNYLASHTDSALESIVFNVFKDIDLHIYHKLLFPDHQ